MKIFQKIALMVVLGVSALAHGAVSSDVSAKLWEKSMVFRGALGDSQTGRVVGYCEVKCGKVSKGGCASVSLKLVPLVGAGKRYPAKKLVLRDFKDSPYVVNWSDKYELTLYRDGTFTGRQLVPNHPKDTVVRDVWSAKVGGELSSGTHYLSFPYWYLDSPDSQFAPVDGSEIAFLDEVGTWRKYRRQVMTSPKLNLSAVPFYAGASAWTFLDDDNNWTFRIRYVPSTGLFSGVIGTVLAPFDVCPEQAQSIRFRPRTVQLSVTGYVIDGQLVGRAKYKRFYTVVSGM